MDFMAHEKSFLHKNIMDMNFRSKSNYKKEDTKKDIAKDLYKICVLADLNDAQIRKVFKRWLRNSHYDFDVASLIASVTTLDTNMSVSELYSALKKLGYDSTRYNKLKSTNFYKELNYKRFINKAINHLYYEIDREEKEIVEQMQYELEVKK